MPTPRKPKPLDAQGRPIDPERLYEPLSSHGRLVNGAPRVYNAGTTKLRGDDEAVQLAPALWVPVDAPDDAKLAARRARFAAASAVPESARLQVAEPPQIPIERLAIADENFQYRGVSYRRGDKLDIDHPAVQAAPQWFRRADRSPLPKRPEAAA